MRLVHGLAEGVPYELEAGRDKMWPRVGDGLLCHLRVPAAAEGVFYVDQPPAVEVDEGLVKGLHFEFGSCLHHVHYLGCLRLPDKVPDSVVGYHHLGSNDTPGTIGPGYQGLINYPLKGGGELDSCLWLLMWGEDINDAVDGLGGVGSMEGGKD